MKKKIAAFILVFAMAAALVSGCSSEPAASETGSSSATPDSGSIASEPNDGGITLTDMSGREVRLEASAERVVALTASDVETLYAIGAGDLLVGRGEFCNYPPEVLDVAAVQSGNETNIEQIIALEPDLILMSKMAQTEEQIQQFEAAGAVVFALDAQNVEDTYTSIELVGKLVGKEAEAGAVVQGMKDLFAELSEKAATGEQKSVYFEVSPLEYGLWTGGKGTFMDDVAGMLGLKNIFDDVEGWAEISEEQVIERNPDYILTVGMYFGDGPTPIESILSRPGWEGISAIQNEAIINLTADEFSRPGPRLAEGARLLYEFIFEGGSATPGAE